MLTIKAFGLNEITVNNGTLENVIEHAKNLAVGYRYVDVFENGKVLYTFYTLSDSANVFEIKH